jgi:hypothetical protein
MNCWDNIEPEIVDKL